MSLKSQFDLRWASESSLNIAFITKHWWRFPATKPFYKLIEQTAAMSYALTRHLERSAGICFTTASETVGRYESAHESWKTRTMSRSHYTTASVLRPTINPWAVQRRSEVGAKLSQYPNPAPTSFRSTAYCDSKVPVIRVTRARSNDRSRSR